MANRRKVPAVNWGPCELSTAANRSQLHTQALGLFRSTTIVGREDDLDEGGRCGFHRRLGLCSVPAVVNRLPFSVFVVRSCLRLFNPTYQQITSGTYPGAIARAFPYKHRLLYRFFSGTWCLIQCGVHIFADNTLLRLTRCRATSRTEWHAVRALLPPC